RWFTRWFCTSGWSARENWRQPPSLRPGGRRMKANCAWVAAVLAALPALGGAGGKGKAPAGEGKAEALGAALGEEDFAGARKDFNAAMKKGLSEKKLKETWRAIVGAVGAFQKQEGTRVEERGRAVFVTCAFARLKLDVKVAFDKEGKVTGFFLEP